MHVYIYAITDILSFIFLFADRLIDEKERERERERKKEKEKQTKRL